MAVLTVVSAKRSANGNDLVGVAAAAGGDSFVNSGQEVVVLKNASAGIITVTVPTPVTVDGLAVADLTAAIGVGETRLLGPFPPAWYNDTGLGGGSVNMTYSGVTTLTVNVVKVTPA